MPTAFPARSAPIPPCPYLPSPAEGMSYRDLNQYRSGERGGPFYFTALQYGQHLWQSHLPARSVLALTRALYCDLQGDEPELADWPLPYAAIAWIFEHSTRLRGVFLGNPRVSFQHQAGRMRGKRKEQRIARAWACWMLARKALPHLPRDERHLIEEPVVAGILADLERHGLPGEAYQWLEVLQELEKDTEIHR